MEDTARTERDKLIIRALADNWMRVGELVKLRKNDLVTQGRQHYLRVRGKGPKERLVGNRRRVEQSDPIPPGGGEAGQVPDGVGHQPAGCAKALVVGRLLGKVGEQVTQPGASEAQPAPLGVEAEHDLGDGQADQL
jgi:hypothetical protein